MQAAYSMKKRVLVFPCGSEIGLEIYRSLHLSTHFEVYGGSSVEDHGKYVYKNYIGEIPNVDDENFLKRINEVIDDKNIDFIIPAHDSVVLRLSEAASDGDLKCEVVTSPLETCQISRSKIRTYQELQDVVRVPEIYSLEDLDRVEFPVFLKPEVGQGSKGTYLARSSEDTKFYLSKDPTLIILEFLPGEEFTVDCFTDNGGKLLFSEGRVRKRIFGGISVNSEAIDVPEFKEIANKINRTLSFRGAWFFQLKRNSSDELVIMEIAPRIAGTSGIVRCKGVNLTLLSLFDRLNYKIRINVNDYDISIDRALYNAYKHNIFYTHVYLDLDDLVIVDGRVNPVAMSFVYQCVNKSIKVHLLTRHKGNLEETLKRHHLTNVFDDIIAVSKYEDKHSYITENKSIFIDDSFSEREQVRLNKNIPTFDSHMIEALLEKF